MSHLKITLNPQDFPQQTLYEIKKFPKWPEGCGVRFLNTCEHELPGIPAAPDEDSVPLAQVEWAWSPMHARVDAYQIHRGDDHWLLWCGGPDENSSIDITNWFAVAFMAANGLSQRDAAMFLLDAFWMFERSCNSLGRYHWINRADALPVGDLQCIANQVWPDEDDC